MPGDNDTESQTGKEARVPAIWKPWPTIGLGVAILAGSGLTSVIFAIAYAFLQFALAPDTAFGLDLNLGFLVGSSLIVSSLVGLGLTVVFIKLRKGANVGEYLGLKPLSGKIGLVLLVVTGVLIAASEGVGSVVGDTNSNLMIDVYRSIPWPVVLWVTVVILAPLFEEALFRGFLFVGLSQSRIGSGGTIVLTAAAWAALHIQYNVYGMANIMVLGIVFGIVRFRTGSLWSSIMMHSCWNFIAMLETALYVNGIIS